MTDRATDMYFEKIMTFTTDPMYTQNDARESDGGVHVREESIVSMDELEEKTGLFVVNTKTDDTGDIFYTRAGHYTLGNGVLVNAAGDTLMAWPLDRKGRLPGESENTDTMLSSLFNGLVPVNLSSIGLASTHISDASTGISVDENGFVSIQFANGVSRKVYQIPLANFKHPGDFVNLNREYDPIKDTALGDAITDLIDAGEAWTDAVHVFLEEKEAAGLEELRQHLARTEQWFEKCKEASQTDDAAKIRQFCYPDQPSLTGWFEEYIQNETADLEVWLNGEGDSDVA